MSPEGEPAGERVAQDCGSDTEPDPEDDEYPDTGGEKLVVVAHCRRYP